MPDKELLRLAADGKLRTQLKSQIRRMLQDDKSWAFIKSFSSQWLDIDRLESVGVKISKYPRYTRFVKEDMRNETYHFFAEVLRKDLSILNFIDSDFYHA